MTKWDFLTAELATLERAGLLGHSRTVESAQGAWVRRRTWHRLVL